MTPHLLTRRSRVAALAVFTLAVLSLVAQFFVSWRLTNDPGVWPVLWTMLGYFTILSNTLVAGTFGWMVLNGLTAREGWLAGLTLWIMIVAVVYHTMLAELWSPVGLAWWADQGLHSAVPAAVLLWWLAAAPKGALRWRHALLWLGWPLLYVIYAVIRGAMTGFYPYPFVDLTVLSPLHFALNVIGLSVAFFVGGLVTVAVGKVLSR